MAKISSTVYLEEKFWKMINDYQNENNLSSRNDALQFMLNEWHMYNRIYFNNNHMTTPNPVEQNKEVKREFDPIMKEKIQILRLK